ncbi:hypothetical protein ACWGTO_33895, partial [Mesorhizobium sp. PL10]
DGGIDDLPAHRQVAGLAEVLIETGEQSLRPKGRCPDRSLGTMGETISLRVPNLPAQARQGRETD